MPEKYDHREITVQPGGVVSATGAGQEFAAGDVLDALFVIQVASITGSFIPKLQFYDTGGGWYDLPGAATASIATVSTTLFHLGAGSTVANVSTTFPPTQRMRWFFTVTTGPAIFTITAHMRLRR